MPGYKTASTIISRAARQLGLVTADITNPYTSTDQNVLLLTSLLQELGDELVREFGWQQLQKEGTFNTANGTASYALSTVASDLHRIVPASQWNRTLDVPLPGSITPQQWQHLQAVSTTGVYKVLHVKGDKLYLSPTPTAVEGIYFEYLSLWWVTPTGQTAPTTETPSAGTDTLWFDPDLLVKGLKFKFKADKGFDSSKEAQAFNLALEQAKGQNVPAPKLSIGGTVSSERMLGESNAPETGYGS